MGLSANPEKQLQHLAVIGASAGGLEPLRRLLGRIQHDHVSYIVATHLSPTWDSQLAPLLQRYSVLPIHKVMTPLTLRPNQVYVVGEGIDLLIRDGMLYTEAANRSVPRRSIDRLMAILAEQWGSHAIGIVLSGAGSDGTAGLAAIRHAGGITMVQTPESAEVPSMPRSAKPFAQYCLEPAALGDELMRLLAAPAPGAGADV